MDSLSEKSTSTLEGLCLMQRGGCFSFLVMGPAPAPMIAVTSCLLISTGAMHPGASSKSCAYIIYIMRDMFNTKGDHLMEGWGTGPLHGIP